MTRIEDIKFNIYDKHNSGYELIVGGSMNLDSKGIHIYFNTVNQLCDFAYQILDYVDRLDKLESGE